MLIHLGVRIDGLPNDQVLGYSGLGAFIITFVLIRMLYFFADGPSEYQSFHVNLAVKGLKTFKILATISLICVCLLGFRVPEPIVRDDFFSLDALPNSWWCIIRIFLSSMVTVAANLFDSHPLFRIYSAIFLPILLLIDLCSEHSLAAQLDCMDRGVCIQYHRLFLFLMTLRDLISIGLHAINTAFAFWLIALFGLWTNEIYLPRKEHRVLSARLDTMSLGPKKIVRIRHGVAVEVGADEGEAEDIVR